MQLHIDCGLFAIDFAIQITSTCTYSNQTTLSCYIWYLKDAGVEYSMKCNIESRAQCYSSKFKQCGLCLRDFFLIIAKTEKSSLNRRSELSTKCQHREKWLLKNVQ